MKRLLFFLFIPSLMLSQRLPNEEIRFIPFVKVKDTLEDAFETYCINDHPNCWAGIGERYLGKNRVTIYRTYIRVNDSLVLINELKRYKPPILGQDTLIQE